MGRSMANYEHSSRLEVVSVIQVVAGCSAACPKGRFEWPKLAILHSPSVSARKRP